MGKIKSKTEIIKWFAEKPKHRDAVHKEIDMRVFWKMYKEGKYSFCEKTLLFTPNESASKNN